jgi:hypothetical protein
MLTIRLPAVNSQQLNVYVVFKKFTKFDVYTFLYDTTETIGISPACRGYDELAVSQALCRNSLNQWQDAYFSQRGNQELFHAA